MSYAPSCRRQDLDNFRFLYTTEQNNGNIGKSWICISILQALINARYLSITKASLLPESVFLRKRNLFNKLIYVPQIALLEIRSAQYYLWMQIRSYILNAYFFEEK